MERATADNLEKSVFTTSMPDSLTRTCVIAINKKIAVSFHHGQHSQLKQDQKIILYNLRDPAIKFETRVLAVSDLYDVIIFESLSGEFSNFPRASEFMFGGQNYMQLGINPEREPSWKNGIVCQRKGLFAIGTSHGKLGDSGSGIFSVDGSFLGLAIGKKKFISNDRNNVLLGEIADFLPDTLMIGSEVILFLSESTSPANDYEPT